MKEDVPVPWTHEELARLGRKLALALEARDAADAMVAHYRQRVLTYPSGNPLQDENVDTAVLAATERVRLGVVED